MQDEFDRGMFKDNVKSVVMMVNRSPVLLSHSTPLTPVPCFECNEFIPAKDCLPGWGVLQVCKSCDEKIW